jgi:hypothetical protein
MDVIQHSLFEEGYLRRDLRAVAESPEVAIAELVANAWDAGASEIDITIPERVGEVISITDNGVGMTRSQFHDRWMKHGYNRTKHQGELAEFPPERSDWRRRAYGRNGIGRHGLLCFAEEYSIESRRFDSTEAHRFTVRPSSGNSAFDLVSEEVIKRPTFGTTVWATVEWKLPDPDVIADALSFEFLHDPRFAVRVNERPLNLDQFKPIDQRKLKISPSCAAEIICIKSPSGKRWRNNHGVAFWIGGRLVGEPLYSLHGIQLLDGRTSAANRYMFVVKSDDFFNEIESDWTRFKRSAQTETLAMGVSTSVGKLVSKLMAGKIQDRKKEAIRQNRDGITNLKPLARIEITEFLDNLTSEHPALNVDVLTSAVKAAVNLEKSRSGQLLLEKLASVSEDDADAINRLLDTWTMRDALTVLDEIDRRMSVVEALAKLMGDPGADELHSIHPLVSHARWLFGPEFDSPIYSSNVTIRAAAKKVFKKKIDESAIDHPRRRPDLIFLKDATLSITGTELFDDAGTVSKLEHLLLIELKRGDSTIGIEEMQQAERYIDDLINCGLLDGRPFIRAFVAGHNVDPRTQAKRIGDDPIVAKLEAVSYGQLVRTAHRRLFKLQEQISDRYKDVPGSELVNKVLGEERQASMFEHDSQPKTRARKRATK